MHFFKSKPLDLLLVITSHILLFYSYSSNASTIAKCSSSANSSITISQDNFNNSSPTISLENFNNSSTNTSQEYNLISLLQSLISKTPSSLGFYKTSVGENPNRLYGLAMCRADVRYDDCENCIGEASGSIVQGCSNSWDRIACNDRCTLRLKNDDFFGKIDTNGYVGNIVRLSKQDSGVDQQTLISKLVKKAPSQPLMFAADDFQVKGYSETRYGFVQCTRDLSGEDCRTCLELLMNRTEYEDCCAGKRGWRIFSASCNVGYDDYPFFSQLLESPVPAPQLGGSEVTPPNGQQPVPTNADVPSTSPNGRKDLIRSKWKATR